MSQRNHFLKDESVSQGKIFVESGGSITFNVNSYRAYEDGIIFKDWTRLSFVISEAFDSDDTWRLELKPFNNAGESPEKITGDYFGKELDISFLSVSVKILANPDGGIDEFDEEEIHELNNGPIILLTGKGNGRFVILISYHIGLTKPLLGQHPDYYHTMFDFHLISDI